MLAEKAAPVESTIASLTAGDAVLRRESAPSIRIRSIPKSFNERIQRFSAAALEGPLSSTLPSCSALAVTTRPRAVSSSPTSYSSERGRFWRKCFSLVAKNIPSRTVISGFAVPVTWSVVSPSIPMEVTATLK